MTEKNKVVLISPDELHIHEAIDENQVRRVKKMMTQTREFYPPLLVDSTTRVILDGHHRFGASKELGCNHIPCYCVDYLDDETVEVESWREEDTVTKEEVIKMGLSDEVFPLKTTRHIYTLPGSVEPVPLAELLA